MKTFFFLLAVSLGCIAEDLTPPSSSESLLSADKPKNQVMNIVPLHVLLSPACPRSFVWVEGTVSEKIDEDTYFIQDRSNSMILFLPTEKLASIPLPIGANILIYGTVDISPVNSTKNELYAEKIIFPQKTLPSDH